MPRPRKTQSLDLTPGQATWVLERMIDDRRISAAEVSRYADQMQREIADLEERLQSLREATGTGGEGAGRRGGRGRAGAGRPAGRRQARLTPEQEASRKLQGRYISLIRQIPASKRGQYQKIAKEKGRESAIKELLAALGK